MKFQTRLKQEILPRLQKELGIKNVWELPRLEKVVVNVGIGKIRDNKEFVKQIFEDIQKITGQKPQFILSRQAISGFKLRAGEKIALRATLRGQRMYDFVDKFINVTLPAIRDFKGLEPKFDPQGNFNLGLKEQSVFPEIKFEDLAQIFSLGINFQIKAQKPQWAQKYLAGIGLPFKNPPAGGQSSKPKTQNG